MLFFTDYILPDHFNLKECVFFYWMNFFCLCSSAPQEGDNHQQSNKNLAELQARKNAIDIVSAICRVAADLLHRAHSTKRYIVMETLGESELFSSLLPLAMAYIGPVASQDPRVC